MSAYRAIVAMTRDGVIGKDGKIPWHYPGDLRRFKELTVGTTVVMGRLTWESLPPKVRPLPDRNNIVVCSPEHFPKVTSWLGVPDAPARAVFTCRSVAAAVAIHEAHGGGPLWFIGGARIYADAIARADLDFINAAIVPDDVAKGPGVVCFPELRAEEFTYVEASHPYEEKLLHRVYRRKS